jgi:hypothetical protein
MWHAWEREKSVQGFGGKTRRKETSLRPRHKWEDGIRMDLREIVWGGVEWIHLAQDRDGWWVLVNTVMNLRVLAYHITFLTCTYDDL